MTNILVECPELIASVRIGVLEPLAPLEREGAVRVRFCRTADIKKSDIAWCDIYICVRGFETANCILARAAKKSGRFLVYFLDDDLGDMPEEIPSADFAIQSNAKENIRTILELSDVLWVVNDLLAQKYGVWCQRTVVSRVPAHPEEIEAVRFTENPLRVLYAGSTDHGETIRQQVSPAIRRLSQEHPGRFTFTFIGADPDLPELENVQHIAFFESYEEYQHTVRSGRFAVGLAPLRDGFFFRCKYYNKFIEYTSQGIAGIYADQEPYTAVVKDGETGYLCAADSDSWANALLRAEGDRDGLMQCVCQARALLKSDFNESAIATQLKMQIPELLDYCAEQQRVYWPLMSTSVTYYVSRARYNFRCFGLLAVFVLGAKVLRKIWRKLFGRN